MVYGVEHYVERARIVFPGGEDAVPGSIQVSGTAGIVLARGVASSNKQTIHDGVALLAGRMRVSDTGFWQGLGA